MKTHFDCITDSGHGWLKVPREMLFDLGIAKLISSYSYQRGDYVYLEEDCDCSVFFRVMGERGHTIMQRLRHSDKYSRIRNYEHFRLSEGERLACQ